MRKSPWDSRSWGIQLSEVFHKMSREVAAERSRDRELLELHRYLTSWLSAIQKEIDRRNVKKQYPKEET